MKDGVCDKDVCHKDVCEDAEAEDAGEEAGGADLKTRAPHNVVGNKNSKFGKPPTCGRPNWFHCLGC